MAAFPDDDSTDKTSDPSFGGALLLTGAGLLLQTLFIAGSSYVCSWIYDHHIRQLTGVSLSYSVFVAGQVMYRLITFRGVGSDDDDEWSQLLVRDLANAIVPWIWFLVVRLLLS